MAQNLEKACKNMSLGSIFMAGKYAFRICFESPFTRMISNNDIQPEIQVAPPGEIQRRVVVGCLFVCFCFSFRLNMILINCNWNLNMPGFNKKGNF